MGLSQAKVDFHLLETAKKSTKWLTHSSFRTTFNLTNKARDTLILVAPDSLPELPGGIYLPVRIFNQVFDSLESLKFVQLTSNQILFTFDQKTISLKIGSTFDATLKQNQPITLLGESLFLKEMSQSLVMTGFERLLKDFTRFSTLPLYERVKGIFSSANDVQKKA